jgi:RNA recognition motif-containing protein
MIDLFLGFVNFDNAESASTALQTMNGFAVGGKQLKVSLKKAQSRGTQPY